MTAATNKLASLTALAQRFAGDLSREVLDEMGAFVYATDMQGRYVYANPMVLQLLGRTLPEILGRTFGEFMQCDGDDREREALDRAVFQDGETLAREERNVIPATGEVRTFWSIKKPMRDAGGAVTGMVGVSYDITEKRRLEDELREQKALLGVILDNVDALVYMKGEDRRFRYANQHMAKALGVPVEAIAGKLDSQLMPREVADRIWRQDQESLASGQRSVSEQALTDANGHTHHYWSVVVPWVQTDGGRAVIGVGTDITELHELKEKLQRQACTDALTGLANRRHFQECAQAEFERSRRYGRSLSLIAIDVDHFKRINDRHGHPVGDRVLQTLTQCIQENLRGNDVFSRTGGEEFCILLPETPLPAAAELAERLRAHLGLCVALDGLGMKVSASFGVTSSVDEDERFDQIFARADHALYAAKDQGRDRVVCLAAGPEAEKDRAA
ncbi:MAG: diguanylate cyclase [Comamonas sp.]